MAPSWSSCAASLLSRGHLRRSSGRGYGPSATPNLAGIRHIRRRRGQRASDPAPAWPRSMARTEEEEGEQEGHGQRRTEHLSSSRVRGLVEEHLAAASPSSLHLLLGMRASPRCVDLIPAPQEVEGRRDWEIDEMEGNLSMACVDQAAKEVAVADLLVYLQHPHHGIEEGEGPGGIFQAGQVGRRQAEEVEQGWNVVGIWDVLHDLAGPGAG